ncbi:YdcF family protein [Candidatus Latescibacterota bacterium]
MKTILFFLILIVILIGLDYAACSLYTNKITLFFMDQPECESDALVVFFGDLDRTNMLGRETKQRLDHCISLYKKDKTVFIVCTGGRGYKKKLGISGSQLMADYLIGAEIPIKNILIEHNSFDSLSNWQETRSIIEAQHWDKVTLISSALHLYRLACITSRDSLEISFSPYSLNSMHSFGDYLSMRKWVHHEWIAFTAQTLLPEGLYRKLLRSVR